jgi:hypothetical protein
VTYTQAWQDVEVDDATASALYSEQLLEVVDLTPAGKPPASEPPAKEDN